VAPTLCKGGEILVSGAETGVVRAKGSHHVVQRHALLPGIRLTTETSTNCLCLSFGVMRSGEWIRYWDALLDGLFQ
jgi:hypothetical protein